MIHVVHGFCLDDVLQMNVVRGVKGVGVVCQMCMCLAQDGVIGLGLCFTNPMGTRRVCDVCVCSGCGGVGGVGDESVAWTRVWDGGVVLCLCVCVLCVWQVKYMYIVLGG